MRWDQRIVYNVVRPEYFSSYTRSPSDGCPSSCPTNAGQAGPSSWYGGGTYRHDVSSLSDQLFYVVNAADQQLNNTYNEFQLSVARLVTSRSSTTCLKDAMIRYPNWLVTYYPAIISFRQITTIN
ncbi:UNVERIFIED_CONTAM: hypothetical protein Slati_2195800 [Sesamum latifolium]|uniref:Uncharacterized protein n=1 Tax=Sesamum latifolium TaxID=2727402 RepID=A0AAW2WXQ8_9LAMI